MGSWRGLEVCHIRTYGSIWSEQYKKMFNSSIDNHYIDQSIFNTKEMKGSWM